MNHHKIGLTVFLIKPDQVAALEIALLTLGAGSIPLTAPLDGVFVPLASFWRGAQVGWSSAIGNSGAQYRRHEQQVTSRTVGREAPCWKLSLPCSVTRG